MIHVVPTASNKILLLRDALLHSYITSPLQPMSHSHWALAAGSALSTEGCTVSSSPAPSLCAQGTPGGRCAEEMCNHIWCLIGIFVVSPGHQRTFFLPGHVCPWLLIAAHSFLCSLSEPHSHPSSCLSPTIRLDLLLFWLSLSSLLCSLA